MKKIHFLENDYQCPNSDESIRTSQRQMSYHGIPYEEIEKMKIHYQFHLMDNEEIYNIIFDKNNILSTYSMYISGSDATFIKFITAASENDVSGITYLDNSGCITDFLNRNALSNYEKYFLNIAVGINTNNILTIDKDDLSSDFNYCKVEIVIPKDRWGDVVKLHKLSKEEFETLLK